MRDAPLKLHKLLAVAFVGLVCLAAGNIAWAGKPDTNSPAQASLEKDLVVLLRVEREGEGNVAASAAWKRIAKADAESLCEVLAALDHAEPLAANYVVAAAETIVEHTSQAKHRLPLDRLKAFVLATEHAPRGRRLAFEWLQQFDAKTAAAMVPGFLHDPSPELRREAVARLLDQAATKKADGADDEALKSIYREALSGACDLDQVNAIKTALAQLGDKVNLAEHFGFITTWQVIGPFDNIGEQGFDVAFPPEQKIDLTAHYEGKPRDGNPRQLSWQETTTQDDFGVVDLNKVIGQENGVVGYAWAEFWSDRQQPAELRLGRDNAAKLWLNGRLVHEHGVYHSGSEMDQYVGRGTLNKGRNTILLKVLQNEQKEDWAQGWSFQLRVCDSAGQAIHDARE
ncbi:MAG TPA: hypothetical protein VFI31_21090 [Pirellulales bacterium]|nr:hypothetical protein [Pirellulales bacterium]